MDILKKAFDAEIFRQEGHRLIDLLADYLLQVSEDRSSKVIHWQSPEVEWRDWEVDFQQQGKPVSELFEAVLKRSIHLHQPGYMGHQISPPAPVAALSGLLDNFLNNGMGVYEMGVAGTAIEQLVVKITAKQMGFGENAGGVLTSGGSLANLTALLAARSNSAEENIWQEGSTAQLALLVSEEAHYCVDRAVRIMGWGEAGIIKVPVNERFKMRTDLLEACLSDAKNKGKEVIAVVGSACSTSTGSFDDLVAIADFCEKHQLWFHVDGAHGGATVFSNQYRHLVEGIERADSVAMDYHKMLLTPAIATALIFKNGQEAYRTFSQKAQYLWSQADEEEWFNLAKRTFECTKLMMGVKVYSIMRTYGLEVFDAFVSQMYDLGRQFAAKILSRKNWELAVTPECNIVCFRYQPQDLSTEEADALNDRVRQQIIEEGVFYIVKTRLRGKTWLRTTLTNPFTREEDLLLLLDKVESLALQGV